MITSLITGYIPKPPAEVVYATNRIGYILKCSCGKKVKELIVYRNSDVECNHYQS
jgi:hypothetical protein